VVHSSHQVHLGYDHVHLLWGNDRPREQRDAVLRTVRRLRETRKKLLRAGAVWWEAKSANAALVAIVESGVKLRKKIVNENGE